MGSLFELRGALNSIEFDLIMLKNSVEEEKVERSLQYFKTELNRQKVKLGRYSAIEFRKENRNSQDISGTVKILASLCEFLESKQEMFTKEDYIRITEKLVGLIEELTRFNHLEEKQTLSSL